ETSRSTRVGNAFTDSTGPQEKPMVVHPDLDDMTRREFIKKVGTTATGLMLSGQAGASSVPKRSLRHANLLAEFNYAAVALASGPHARQLEQTHGILMGLNEDSLLRPFRLAAALPAPGSDLGGWYSATPALVTNGPTGPETFGQWISALS